MNLLRPRCRMSGRIRAGGLLLAMIAATTATISPTAVASPLPATAARHQAGASQPKPGQVSWSVLPATATGPDNNRQLFSYGVIKPGSTIVDHVEVVNRSRQSAAFAIYATDAVGTTLQDALLLAAPGAKPADIGSWVTFPGGVKQMNTVIPSGKGVIESFSVRVPLLATPGDHTGAVVAAVSIPGKNGSGLAITQNYRIGVPLELRVPGALHGSVQVQSISTGFSDPVNPFGAGSAVISYTVANTGNVRETGNQLVTVTGPFGQSSTVRPPRLPVILPGTSVRVSVSVPGLYPAGPMNARVTITPAWPPRTPPLARLTPIAAGSASLFAMPWSLVGFILLLAAVGVGVMQLLRWRRRLHRAEIASAAARARRETERRLLGSRSGTARRPASKSAASAADSASTSGSTTE